MIANLTTDPTSCIYNSMASRRHEAPAPPTASARISSECLAVRVRILGRVVTSIYDEALRPFDVTVGQINILVTVTTLGDNAAGADAAPTQSMIGNILAMEKSTLSRNVERLVRDGLLRRTTGEDARSKRLRVTAKGQRLIERILPAWERAQSRAQELLGPTAEHALHESADEVWRKAGRTG